VCKAENERGVSTPERLKGKPKECIPSKSESATEVSKSIPVQRRINELARFGELCVSCSPEG